MQVRKLGQQGLQVSAIGLGCMAMSCAYGKTDHRYRRIDADEQQCIATLQRAVELGVTMYDTAEIYGPYVNEELLGRALHSFRDRIVIGTKFGYEVGADRLETGLDSRPEHVREVADASLQRLGGDHIDLFYLHRVDPAVPLEDTVGAMADLVRAGKVRFLGLSEVKAATIRRAHKVHPISVVQSEWSVWARDQEHEVLPTCRELGIGFVAHGPLGRGFLTGAIRTEADIPEGDFRRTLPRFHAENLPHNLQIVVRLEELAQAKGCTSGQLALAWLLHQGDDIVPIPGAEQIPHLQENVAAADIRLSTAELDAIRKTIPAEAVIGERYAPPQLALIGR